MTHYSSLRELYYTRLREFYRQPARIFWVYGFPTILAIGLALAFRSREPESIAVNLVRNAASGPIKATLEKYLAVPRPKGRPGFHVKEVTEAEADKLLLTGKIPLVVVPDVGPTGSDRPRVTYRYDQTRPEAVSARAEFDDALQRAYGRADSVAAEDRLVDQRGSRYIDFLIPGLIGLNTMGGGLWGIGFLLVNYRIAKLLKRFMATPMPRRNFLLALLGARVTFLLPDVGVLLLLGNLAFGMPIRGNLGLVVLVDLCGALAFAGIGLLIACRAATTESVSGLINLTMLPMWLLSGVFFSSDRFPPAVQPLIQALPLTQLVGALRRVILEGAGPADVAGSLAILAAWAVVTFGLALRLFRWT